MDDGKPYHPPNSISASVTLLICHHRVHRPLSAQKQSIAAYKMKGDSQRPHIVYVRRSDAKLNARGEALKQRVQG